MANLFENANYYEQLYKIAVQQIPPEAENLGQDEFGVAILHHNKNCQSLKDVEACDFLWFKVKGKHSVSKLTSAYAKRSNIQAGLKFANRAILDTTHMRELNHMKTNIVVFTAHPGCMDQNAPTSSSAMPTPVRNPLQPINAQLSANTNPLNIAGKPLIKPEPTNSTPYDVPRLHPAIASSQRTTAPLGTENIPMKNEPRSSTPTESSRVQYANASLASKAHVSPAAARPTASNTPPSCLVKAETGDDDSSMSEAGPSTSAPVAKQPSLNERLQTILETGSPEILEAEVKRCQIFLKNLQKPLVEEASRHKDAKHWLTQIESLQQIQVDTPTIIGVVGNTGAGKSSVINAMLEEERLVPTNCMRACTAVVTEMSWNSSDDENAKYRADIEFIKASDWEKDLRVSLNELIDANGEVSRECSNPESEAGIAYAKIKAVYPMKTKDMLALSTVEQLMNEPGIKELLGTTKCIMKRSSETFYRALQAYVDSKEKKDKKKDEKKVMEFWPLIKVVRIKTKSDALSTGAVIVDLPGVHDSNAARAAVAAGYMKQCTGLFIVAPINRAVDDKAAKSLLGESFKRQLKFDGTYSRITFICSKTDDISITEAADSLGLEEEMAGDWEKIDALGREQRDLKRTIGDLKESKGVFTELLNDADDAIEIWDKLKDELEDGKEVWAPSDDSKKRKRSAEPKKSRKKSKMSHAESDNEDNFIDDDANTDDGQEGDNNSDPESGSESGSGKGDPLTLEEAEAKLDQLKADKKRARQEKSEADAKIKALTLELKASEKNQADIEATMSAICIEGRNKYSKGAIQQDFADGIRELDQESAQEEDPDQFNPEQDLRDYTEVARSLPVFCVSSRAYQKIRGRLQRDNNVGGFRSADETEIPQLQAHCKKLTEAGRASNCRRFLTTISQVLNSLRLWASNDGTGNLSDAAALAIETRFLKQRLMTLEKSLEKAVKDCLKDMNEALAEHIFENYPELVELAVSEANQTVGKWHRPVNRDNRALGGFYWATYKAVMRREGVFSNAQGIHDFNLQLIEPIIKHLAGHWERVFAQRLPRVLQAFSRESKNLLARFHHEIEGRSMKIGAGAAGMALLGQQLKNYEAQFVQLSEQLTEIINGLQREANREFTPVVARNLATAYDWCTAESGPGQYKRMKDYMSTHVNDVKTDMFSESCNEVKRLLVAMCNQVEQTMTSRTDEVFMLMQRDYIEVVSGTQLPEGQMMPKWERKMRAGVAKVIEDQETEAEEVTKASEEEQLRTGSAAGSGPDISSKEELSAEKEKSEEEEGRSLSSRSVSEEGNIDLSQ